MLKKALDVIDFSLQGKKSQGLTVRYEDHDKTYYCLSKHFAVEQYDVKTSFIEESDEERFFIYTCVEGEGSIEYVNGKERITVGDSIMIPATLGSYRIIGKLKLLKSYVPDIDKVEKEILSIIEG